MNTRLLPISFALFYASIATVSVRAELEPGDKILLSLRGVAASEQEQIDGAYRVGKSGKIRLPLLKGMIHAQGLTPEQFARAAEKAYISQGIYSRPAIEVDTVQGIDQKGTAIISVAGQVRRAGQSTFQKDMTVLQAIDSVGGRNEFGGRNVFLIRKGRQYCLDFKNLQHKNIRLQPGDSLQVSQKRVIDRWKGNDKSVKPLLKP
jgi:protein involved in polysaccharide export with SLBB domain